MRQVAVFDGSKEELRREADGEKYLLFIYTHESQSVCILVEREELYRQRPTTKTSTRRQERCIGNLPANPGSLFDSGDIIVRSKSGFVFVETT